MYEFNFYFDMHRNKKSNTKKNCYIFPFLTLEGYRIKLNTKNFLGI